MPVLKLPVVHKFGIISHSQRLQLQSRIVDDINLNSNRPTKSFSQRNQWEIDDYFVSTYNDAIKSKDKTKKAAMTDLGQKIFCKIQRSVGICYNCERENHIDLRQGWTELVTTSRCEGSLGDDCLLLLLQSLQVAPIAENTVSPLLFLLETAMYFIQTTTFSPASPLRHVRWLQIGEVAATRLYVITLTTGVRLSDVAMDNLRVYIQTFGECTEQLRRVHIDCQISATVIIETVQSLLLPPRSDHDYHSTGALLWHSIDLWRCSFYTALTRTELSEAVHCIRICLETPHSKYGCWMDCYLAVKVLANCASFSSAGLDILSDLLQGSLQSGSDDSKLEERDTKITNPDEEIRVWETAENKEDEAAKQKIEVAEVQTNAVNEDDQNVKNRQQMFEQLIVVILREYCQLSIKCRSSAERERALSVLAELVMHGRAGAQHCLPQRQELPPNFRNAIVSCLSAVYSLASTAGGIPMGSEVIANPIWSLLGAIERRWKDPDISASEEFGRVMLTATLGPAVSDSECVNGRVSRLLLEAFFPQGASKVALQPIPGGGNKRVTAAAGMKMEKVKKRDIAQYLAASKKPHGPTVRMTRYQQASNVGLRKITDHYWEEDLPLLEKQISDLQASSTETKAAPAEEDKEGASSHMEGGETIIVEHA